MLRSIDELVGLLRELASRCAELLQAAEREHQALQPLPPGEMQSAAAEKEAILQGNREVERRRAVLLGRLAAEAAGAGGGADGRGLADRLPQTQASR
jgi:hypothetical protein